MSVLVMQFVIVSTSYVLVILYVLVFRYIVLLPKHLE
jgi:hypothetical protein